MTIIDELFRILRYGAVGLLATLVHFLVAVTVGIFVGMSSVLLMNTAGFMVAFVVSFLGHYHFTFLSKKLRSIALAKFLLVALLAYAASALSIELAGFAGVPDIIRLLAGVVVIPVVSYAVNRKLVF